MKTFDFFNNKKLIFGFIAVATASLLWSIDGLFLRTKLYELPAELVIFIEHFLGFILLLPFLIRGKNKLKYLSLKDWGAIIWISFIGSVIGTLFITKAFFMTFTMGLSISIIVILQKLQPISALILARLLLGEKLSKRFYFWALIAIASAFFLVMSFGQLDLSLHSVSNNPALYAIIAAIAFGSSTVFGKHLINHIDYKTTASLRFTFGSIFSFIIVMAYSKIGIISTISHEQWQSFIIIALTTGTSAMFIYYYGLKKISASTATLAELFFPFFTIILEYIFFGKLLTSLQIFSSVIFLYAIFKATQSSKLSHTFTSKWVKGAGRGAKMGLRTINLDIKELDLNFGVYLVNISISESNYLGLMHYGPILTFEKNVSVELYVTENIDEVENKMITIEVLKKIRNIKKFKNKEKLINQIKKDIVILKKNKKTLNY